MHVLNRLIVYIPKENNSHRPRHYTPYTGDDYMGHIAWKCTIAH